MYELGQSYGLALPPMTKLSNPSPLVAKLPSLVAQAPSDEVGRSRFRDRTQHWRAWYKTARWQHIRKAQLEADCYTCRMCKRVTTELVCDHVEPHRGNEAMFWSGPFQSLCHSCHDSRKQAEERHG